MGLSNSKVKEPPENKHSKKSKDEINEIILFSNGDKYEGKVQDNEICGIGTYFYRSKDVYKGEWKNNKKHGRGTHYYVNQGKRYVGEWQNGFYHGYGEILYADSSSFKGTFFEGEKHGIGHYQNSKGSIYEERWVYGALKSRTLLSEGPEGGEHQAETNDGEGKNDDDDPPLERRKIASKDRDIIDAETKEGRTVIVFNEIERVNKDYEHGNEEEKNDSENDRGSHANPKRKLFETEITQTLPISNNGSQNDSRYEDSPKNTPNSSSRSGVRNDKFSENSLEGKDDRFATANALRSQEGDTDSTKMDIGIETLNILEHMEALNSAANYLLSKKIEDWTADDVGDWLKHLGIGEYVEQFKANHISGVNLLDLTDADLKQEFKITSLGHRKNIRKAIDQLSQIYRSGKDAEYVKNKIQSFYNKNSRFKRNNPLNSFGSTEGGLNSFRKLHSGVYNSTHQVIQEDNDEAELFSKSPPETKIEKRRSGEQHNFKLDSNEEKTDNDDTLPRKIRDRKPSFASGVSGASTPDETKRKKRKSTESKKSNSDKGSHNQSQEIDFNFQDELTNKDVGQLIGRIPSPFKKEEIENKPKEERNLLGNYLLHNQYDSHEHRENIIANQNNINTPSHSYEGSSPTDSETSSSEEEAGKHLKSQLSKPGGISGSIDQGQKNNPTLNQILFGTTGEIKRPEIVNKLLGIGENNMNEINKPLFKKNHSTPCEIRPRNIKHNSTPPAVLNPQLDNESQFTKHQQRQDEQPKRIDENQVLSKRNIIAEERGKLKRSSKKNTLSTKEDEQQIKEEILKIFKQTGLNENFIINYDELTIKGKIGEGGYGQVYEGTFSGTEVAIKEYGKRNLRGKAAEDFVKEVEVISSLRHPNIVLYMGACIHKGKYLMITEYLEHGSLFDHLHRKHKKIPEEYLLDICEDITLGMAYLHSRKVLHCDLKSSNILIDSNWSVKLCDFGLSRNKIKYNKKKKANKVQRVGTPHWMAPEILRGEHYDEMSDVYSYGMVLWEMVTGDIPYYNVNVNEIIFKVGWEGKQAEIPTRGNPLIIEIMKMCLNLDREKRPTFKEIIDILQPKLKDTRKSKPSSKQFPKK